jgi:hypothetical protein
MQLAQAGRIRKREAERLHPVADAVKQDVAVEQRVVLRLRFEGVDARAPGLGGEDRVHAHVRSDVDEHLIARERRDPGERVGLLGVERVDAPPGVLIRRGVHDRDARVLELAPRIEALILVEREHCGSPGL